MNQLTDPFTGEVFTPLRSNQKFANRKNQIAYNNAIAKKNRKIKSPILSELNNNHKILIKVLGNDKSAIKSKDYLLGAGFNFSVFSKRIRTNDGVYQVIYDYGISTLEGDAFKIIKV